MFFEFLVNSIIILATVGNATVSIIDSNPFLKDFVAIYVPIYSALIGAAAAFVFLIGHERSKDRREIKKIKSLLNSDFSQFYNDIVKDKKFVQNALDTLNETDGLTEQLISGKLVIANFYQKYGVYYELDFWNAIISSGSLLKLNKDEISSVQAVQNSMNWYNTNLNELQNGTSDYLEELLLEEDPEYEIDSEEVTETLKHYFESTLGLMKDCIDDLEKLKQFSWINFEKK